MQSGGRTTTQTTYVCNLPNISVHTHICMAIISECSSPLGVGSQEWKDFMAIYELIEKIKTVQKGKLSTLKQVSFCCPPYFENQFTFSFPVIRQLQWVPLTTRSLMQSKKIACCKCVLVVTKLILAGVLLIIHCSYQGAILSNKSHVNNPLRFH